MFVALSLTVPDVDGAADSSLDGGHCTFPNWATDIGILHRLGFVAVVEFWDFLDYFTRALVVEF